MPSVTKPLPCLALTDGAPNGTVPPSHGVTARTVTDPTRNNLVPPSFTLPYPTLPPLAATMADADPQRNPDEPDPDSDVHTPDNPKKRRKAKRS